MKNLTKKLIIIIITSTLLLTTNSYASEKNTTQSITDKDYDPNTDLKLTVTITQIRALDNFEKIGDPDFYVKIYINDQEYTSPVFQNQKYLYGDPYLYQVTSNIPDYLENITVQIQLWDKQPGLDRLCDISDNLNEYGSETYDIILIYNTKYASWVGGDFINSESPYFDESGYGRLNGCDDNSIYENDRDCELYFNINQSDTDGDNIPYWTEVNIYGTDPMVNDTGRDDDQDGVPIEWEFKWGKRLRYDHHTDKYYYEWFYDPFTWENHSSFDPDRDGLDNVEEYKTSQWGSDPFRKDIFVELDQMEAGPNGEPASLFPENSKELIKNAFHRRNIVYHFDDGCMGGGEMIPFIEHIESWSEGMNQVYEDYFLHGDENNWRKGVFHWGAVLYDAGFEGYNFRDGAWQISTHCIDTNFYHKIAMLLYGKDVAYASVYMHEHGHALGLNVIYGHDTDSYYPWQINYWKYRPYKSCMNYGYTYILVDFSDGSRGKNDMDDWGTIDLTLFQKDIPKEQV